MSRFSHSCILAVVMFITVIVVPRWGASAHSPSQVAPVAIVTYTTNTGGTTVVDAETVLFDGTSSYDPDGGSITKYRWRINGSVQGTTSTFSWTFDIADGASQTVRLSIWDDENEYKQTDVVLSVVLGGNQSPVASFTPLGSTVNDLQVVPFSSTSTDPDGTISAQEWFVGSLGGTPDGTSTTLSWTVDIGSGTTQTVYLVVEDNDAAKDTTSAVFTVQAAGSQQITRQYYLKDHLGSTRVTVDDAGDVVQYADYYPFGMLLPARNGVFGTSTVRELYTGHQKDDTTGLFYAGARYYDPMVVRWGTIDPESDKYAAWSPYNYVLNSPYVLVDPDGRDVRVYGKKLRRQVNIAYRKSATFRKIYNELRADQNTIVMIKPIGEKDQRASNMRPEFGTGLQAGVNLLESRFRRVEPVDLNFKI